MPPAAAAAGTLTVGEVRAIRTQRAQVNHETYKTILARAYERIKRRAGANFSCLDFPVPPFVPGRPVFAHAHAVRYVTEKLRRGGFGVEDRGDGTLHVDWHAPAGADAPEPRRAPPAEAIRAGRAPPPAATKAEDISRRLDNLKRRLRSFAG